MKKKAVLLVGMLVVFACAQKLKSDDLKQLNGYWEITAVHWADGSSKTYNANPVVDYIELKGLKGFKKKAQPKFDGTYTVSDDAEAFVIIEEDATFTIHYKNKMSQWQEELISISKTQFSVVNEDGITYVYKRYKPINAKE